MFKFCTPTPSFCYCGIDLFGGKSSTDNIDANLIFHLKLRASNLLVATYTEYQQFLYEAISRYLEEGWNYQEISDKLNELNVTTFNGNSFQNKHVHMMLNRYHHRQVRLNLMKTEYEEEWSKMEIKYENKPNP